MDGKGTVRKVASGNLREYGNVTLYMLIDQAEGYGLETDAKLAHL